MRVCDTCGACSDDEYELCGVDGGTLTVVVPGSRILAGRYRLERQLAQGAMGQVFEAVHLAVGSRVAVKVMQPRQRDVRVAVQRFHKEARMLGAVKHPNAVLITDFDVDHRSSGAVAFLVTELLRGRSLAALLDERGLLGIDDVERIIVPLCEAVEEAHAQGIIHRDLKPSNVFLERLRDGTEVVKVLDFGIAKLLARRDDDDVPVRIVMTSVGDTLSEQSLRDEIQSAIEDDVTAEPSTLPGRRPRPEVAVPSNDRSTFAGLMVGTVPYMAAEQMTGERVTRRTDVHALAVLIFEMLSGRLPFDGDDDEVIAQKLADDRPSLREQGIDIDVDLDALLMRSFSATPDDRPERVTALAEAVVRAALRTRGAVEDPVGSLALRLSATARALARLEDLSVVDADVMRDTLLSAGNILTKARPLLRLAMAALSAPPQGTLVAAHLELDDAIAAVRTGLARVAAVDADGGAHLFLMWRRLDAFADEVGDLVGDEAVDVAADPFADPFANATAADVDAGDETKALPWSTLMEHLTGKDPLDAVEAFDAMLDERVDDLVRVLHIGGDPAAELVAGLWRFAEAVLLRDLGAERGALRFLPLLAGAAADQGRFSVVVQALRDRRGPALVDDIDQSPVYEPLLRCLLLHPIEETRRRASQRLPLASLWTVAAHPRTPLAAQMLLFREIKKRGHPDHLKVYFFCVRESLLSASTSELREAVVLVREFFELPAFHEDLLFEPLLDVERQLRARAGAAGLLDESYARAVAVFVGAGSQNEVQLEHLRDVPLALQRKLAREGRFMSTFVCHGNERIAKETVPHLLRLEDITKYLRLATIHRAVLVDLAKRRRFFKKDAPRLALLSNPKTPASLARAYIGLVADEQLKQLAANRHINPDVRRLIQQALLR